MFRVSDHAGQNHDVCITHSHMTRAHTHTHKSSNQDGHHYGDKETTIIFVSRAPVPTHTTLQPF